MAKLRLYQITDTKNGRPVPDFFFTDKISAKAKRRELNGDETELEKLRFVVSPGPDHRLFKKGA
mgnify:CR=1 FL=1